MNISDVIDQLEQGKGYRDDVSKLTAAKIRKFVYSDTPYADCPANSSIPTHYIFDFFDEYLDELDDTPEHIARYLHALITSVNEMNWLHRVDLALLRQLMPTFQGLLKFDFRRMNRMLNDWGMTQLLDTFTHEDLKIFLSDERLKSEGHYNHSSHLYCRHILFPELKQAVSDKDAVRFESLLLTYLEALARDHVRDANIPDYHGTIRQFGLKYRTALPSDAIQSLIALLKGQGDRDRDVAILRAALPHQPILAHGRTANVLLEADPDFSDLFDYLCHSNDDLIQQSTAANALKSLIFQLDPYLWIQRHFLTDCYHRDGWLYPDSVIEGLRAGIAQAPELQEPLIAYVLRYNFEHYPETFAHKPADLWRENPHVRMIQALIREFGAPCLWTCFEPRSAFDAELGYAVIASLTEDGSLDEQKTERDRQLLRDACNDGLTKNDNDSESLIAYVLTGENEANISRLSLQKNAEFPRLSTLSDPHLQRFTRLMLNGKNNALFSPYLRAAQRLYTGTPLRLISDVVLEQPAYSAIAIKGYAEYTEAFIAANEDRRYGYYDWEEVKYLRHHAQIELCYLQQHGMPVIQHMARLPAKYKAILLPFFRHRIQSDAEAVRLLGLLNEKHKGAIAATKACILSLSEEYRQVVKDTVISDIATYSAQQEINAIDVLCELGIDSETASQCLMLAKVPSSRTLLITQGQLDIRTLYTTADGTFDLDAYLADSYHRPKKSPVDFSQLMLPARLDGRPSDDAAMQLCLIYQGLDGYQNSQEAAAITSVLSPESLSQFAHSILSRFGSDIPPQNKWLLSIPAIHGDTSVMKALATLIEKIAGSAKHQLAGHLIKMMGLSGQTQAYIEIDRICRNAKKQSIKDAGQEAFAIGAQQAGITKEELGDQLVDDLGFDGDHIPLDYCGQTLSLILNGDLKFVIRKPDGKLSKTLPKPKPNDDAEQAEQTKQHFNALKKLLKEMISLQTKRMEDAFVAWRMWSFERWQVLFLGNPVMHKIASQLIWGVYENGQLIRTFLPNPTPVDMADEPVAISAEAHVGLVHPIELTAEQLADWQNYVDDWNLEPLFGQLSRDVVQLKPATSNQYSAPCFSRKTPATVINRLRKCGWSVGSVRDGGSFDEIYKELDGLNVGIEITFDGDIWHSGYGYESDEDTVTAQTVEFYRTGHLNRGSYVYDDLQDHKYADIRLTVDDIPERVVRELLLEAKKAFL
ncbi:DUF4132 domain-containing protein [Photobacterium galatheae]|uniref:DUF4132 domain-containing protein n=1 Tax=Photobacterium galatheae TaxID=1654360 RepID=A0A066RIP8_9GAMM|nr:DUF4132 domain-containing protein [Photobacterium galatheae]KDM90320.1 hypothetical protein EA58_17645 [Photobacterium galatheae]MCM0150799.1 DUF4132 domain-containing protein [Photobacterium galatheae]